VSAEFSLPLREPNASALLGWRKAWLGIDKAPRAVAFAQSLTGRIAIYALFVAVLWLGQQLSATATVLVSITVAACLIAPHRKLAIMALSGVVYFLLRPFRTKQQIEFSERLYSAEVLVAELPALPAYLPVAAVFLLVCYGWVRLVQLRPSSLPGRRPLLCQYALFAALLTAGLAAPPGTNLHALVWLLIVMLAASFFFLAYALMEARSRDTVPSAARVGFMRPFWGGPSLPFKGPSYLQKFEAESPGQLAAVRLRALKLIVWATLLAFVCRTLEGGVYGIAALPTLPDAIAATVDGDLPGRAFGWMILFKTFVLNVISLGALVHTLVAVIRICGYGIPRGMARPLSARTIAEFWNRYLFYFKELLVDFFFYPAFVRFFKKQPKLRIAIATFSAAFIGNLLFSVISQSHLFAEIGIVETLRTFDSYAVYALALSLALIASQLRARKPRPEDGFLRYQVVPRMGVIGFFCVAQIFADESFSTSLAERAGFLAYLMGA
jgi:hypothetical protein